MQRPERLDAANGESYTGCASASLAPTSAPGRSLSRFWPVSSPVNERPFRPAYARMGAGQYQGLGSESSMPSAPICMSSPAWN